MLQSEIFPLRSYVAYCVAYYILKGSSIEDVSVCSNPFFLSHTTQGLNVFIWQCWREKHKYFEGGIYTWPSFCFVFYNSPAPHWSWSRLLVLTTGPLWVNSRVKLLNYLPFRLRWFALTTPVQIWLFSSVSLYVYVKTEKKVCSQAALSLSSPVKTLKMNRSLASVKP